MTVSRTLRNAPGVAPSTRRRILALAQRVNYRPDPALAVLNAYRLGSRKRAGCDIIAFLTNYPSPDDWKQVGTFVRYFEGASRRARELGYRLEPFWMGDPQLNSRRMSQILRDRGIRGLIVGPLSHGQSSLDLEWDWFCAVALGRSLGQPGLTTVSTNHFHAVGLAWEQATSHGFQRIGLALSDHEDARTVGALRASYLLRQAQTPLPAVPVLLARDLSGSSVANWVNEYRPDVLMSSEQRFHDVLANKQRRILPFIHLNINPRSSQAGIDQGHDLVGEHATALLHLKLMQRETGVPKRRDLSALDCSWKEGSFFPERKDPAEVAPAP